MNTKQLPILLIIFFPLILVSCQEDPEKLAEQLSETWCDCNKGLIPLYESLEQAESPQQRTTVLDSMHQVAAQNMECLGGEKKWVEKDQQMTDIQKDLFLKTFRRSKEETCPEVFRVISALEEDIK